MRTVLAIGVITTTLGALLGCQSGPPAAQQVCSFSLGALTAMGQMFYAPPALPVELQSALENPQRFVTPVDPLEGVAAGTPMDALANLHGCWAKLDRVPLISLETGEPLIDPQTGQALESSTVTLLCFDVAGMRLTRHAWSEHAPLSEEELIDLVCGGVPGGYLPTATAPPMYLSTESSYEILDDGQIFIHGIDGDGGRINPDGSTAFSFMAVLGISIESTTDYPMLVTVAGDYLKTREGGFEPSELVVGENEEDARLWVRMK